MAEPGRLDRLKAEAGYVLRFGVVGIAATAVHTAVAFAVLALAGRPLLANLAGFLVAFVVSFGGHAGWTFALKEGRRRAAARFFIVSAASFLFSTVVLAGLVRSGLVPQALALAIAIAVVPLCNFIAARLWAFEPAAPPA